MYGSSYIEYLESFFILSFFALFKSLGNIPVIVKFTISAHQGSLTLQMQ